MNAYNYNSFDLAVIDLNKINKYWGFCAKGMMSCFTENDIYYHPILRSWYIVYDDYSNILGTPVEIPDINNEDDA